MAYFLGCGEEDAARTPQRNLLRATDNHCFWNFPPFLSLDISSLWWLAIICNHCGANNLLNDVLVCVVNDRFRWTKCLWFKNIAKGTTDPRVEFISQVQTQILIKFHPQIFDQASTSKSLPNINILTKLKLQHFELQPKNLDQTLCSNSEQKFKLMTNLQLPHLHQTVVNTFLSTNISNSNNHNYF